MSQGLIRTGLGSIACDEVKRIANIPGMDINPVTAPTVYAAWVACFGLTAPAAVKENDYRENPAWCGVPGVETITGWFGSKVCTPQSNAEQSATQRSELEHTCRNAANPTACVEGALIKSQAEVDAATRSEAEKTGVPLKLMECEQKAAEESPVLSNIFGPATICAWETSGISGSALLWGGAALVLFIAFKASRR